MLLVGGIGFGAIVLETKATRIEAQRMVVVMVLMFFSMLFWAFFEQAGVRLHQPLHGQERDRVFETEVVSADQVGHHHGGRHPGPNGRTMGDKTITMADIDGWREDKQANGTGPSRKMTSAWARRARRSPRAPGANPVYIMIRLVFSALWTMLGKRGLEGTPVKFALGIGQLGLGFGALWYGAAACNEFGIVGMSWLMIAYLLITTGGLLSPVGLSMVTSFPKRIVSMVMGAWFLATAFSNYLSAIIAQFTGVGHAVASPTCCPPSRRWVCTARSSASSP